MADRFKIILLILCLSGLAAFLAACEPALAVPPTHSVVLALESQAVDLDSGAVYDERDDSYEHSLSTGNLFADRPEADVAISFHADRDDPAVVLHNQENGALIAHLADTAFESVTSAAGVALSGDFIDKPFKDSDTIVVRTDTGADFKLGRPVLDLNAGTLTFDYEALGTQSAAATAGNGPPRTVQVTAHRAPSNAAPSAGSGTPAAAALPSLVDYELRPVAGRENSFIARNAAQQMVATFDPDGVHVSSLRGASPWTTGLTFLGWGYAQNPAPLSPTTIVASGSRVEYRRGTLVEWYENAPRGLEQGFTISHRPGSSRDEPLSVHLGLSGSLVPRLDTDGLSIALLDERGRTAVEYGGLVAWDRTGQILPARMATSDGELLLEVDDTDAVYPITIDPTIITEDHKLHPGCESSGDSFGFATAMSGDTLIVTAYNDDDTGLNAGAAYVYVLREDEWLHEAKLTAADGESWDRFGWSAAISGDTVLIGAPLDDDNGMASGSAYVFERDDLGIWHERGKLLPADGAAKDQFGYAVALAGDLAIVSANLDDDGGLNSGSAYAFRRSLASWTQEAKLTASDGGYRDYFGTSVAVSGDTIVVGADRADAPTINDTGAVYVFTWDGTAWNEYSKLMASDCSKYDYFGYGVALTSETIFVSSYRDDDLGCDAGSLYVFAHNTTDWVESTKLTPSNASAAGCFGFSVAAADDMVAVGAHGSALLFSAGSGSWQETAMFAASDEPAFARYGDVVGMTGEWVAVSAHADHGCGSVYLYELANESPTAVCGDVITPHDPDVETAGAASIDDGSWDPDGDTLALSQSPPGPYSLGNTSVTLTATDPWGESDSCVANINVFNRPPVASCADVTATHDEGVCSADVTVDDGGSYDPDGDSVTTDVSPPGPYPLGTTTVTLVATDTLGDSDSCTATVTVTDVTPPSISFELSPTTLWPPNHQLVGVAATVTASDVCEVSSITLASILSDEPDDAAGIGDGATRNDIQHADYGTADFEFDLRAERAATEDGRVYTVTYTATDSSGNSTSASGAVGVPLNQGGSTEPLDLHVDDNELGTVASWVPVIGAQAYNVIRARLEDIVERDGMYSIDPAHCIEANSHDENTYGDEDAELPAPGRAFVYLVEYEDGPFNSGYGTESAALPRVAGEGDCH